MRIKITPKGFFAILCIFLFAVTSVTAQIHERLQREGNYSYQQIINLSEQYFDQVGRGKGVGYKQFQRWKYWAERNLDQNGNVRDNREALQDYRNFVKSQGAQSNGTANRTFTGGYIELGPLTSVYTSTWSSGLGRVSAIGLDANNDNHIIVGSPTGGIWKTTNLGGNWSPLFDDQANIDVYALEISHSNANHYWAGLNGGMVRSTDGGTTWSNVSGIDTNDLYNTITMHPTNSNIVYAVGQYRGKVFKSTDGGNSFSLVLDITKDLFDLEFHPTNSNIVYVSGEDVVYISTDGGNNFSQVTTGPWNGSNNIIMLAVTPAAPNNVYALEEQSGGFNALYLSQNSGSSWSTLDSFNGSNNIMGYDQNVQSGQAPRDMDIIVSPVNANIIHVAGVETWRSTNLGQSWTKTTFWNNPGGSNFIHADIDLLIYDGNRIVAGTDGGIYFSTNEATSWTDISAGLAIRQFYRIGASQTDTDRVSGGSQDNGTGTLVNGTWRDWLGADGMETFIDWNNADIIYGTVQNGVFYKSVDGGNTRTSISNSPPSGNWVTPFEQDPANSNTIYAATDQIYKSTNGGGSWSTLTSFSTGGVLADEMKISPVNPNYIYISYDGIIYRTTDGGNNWSSINIPSGSSVNYITLHPTDANRLAIAVSGSSSKVFESLNGGSTWSDITRNIPSNVTIECVLYDEATDGGFYAGGNPGIYYTSNPSSANYSDVTLNLPKVRVTELEIRNEVLYVGTYGRGLWKYEFSCDGSLAGQACDDLDACTDNDVYDANCNCSGTAVADSDGDGICDTLDQCPGFDDNIDFDLDGIPDGCDSSIECNSCDTPINSFPHVEDFENGTSGICQFTTDDINWSILSGATGSTGTGPTAAHSGSNYFYVEASDPNYPTKVAIFKGACYDLQNASSATFNFWYHMYGATVNEIKLDISTDGGATYTTLWTQTGNQGNQWLNANLDISGYISSQFSYAFTVTTGSNWESDIAVDLITVDAVLDVCAANGGDADGDGVCADIDCNDNDPNIGAEGTSCDDGDDCTENDVFDENCNCAGTPVTTDTDGDGVLDCVDQEINSPCPQDVDANGVSNDDDNDGIPNCNDTCNDLIDTDGDGTPDCTDNCPNDPNKTEAGDCGCGVADTDTDGDGIADCNDQEINSPCPQDVDANGISNDDDGDGIPNCNDTCNDLVDTDGDGVFDCDDQEINSPCPLDVDTNGVSNDNDGDGIPNCNDGCDDSIDTDGDGTSDCIDNCPNDPNKIQPGDCGCGIVDTDTDGDGIADCNDQEINSPCPQDIDANGVSNDDDGDGIPNCNDTCDNSIDTDGDGIDDCNDQEINSPCPQDVDANGVSNDDDGDGVANCNDICPIGDDTIDSDGDGTPDDCEVACSQTTSSFPVSQLTHSGFGSNSTTLVLTGGTHIDVSFSITEINSRSGGKPDRRFIEEVIVTYVDGNGSSQTYGTFRGDTTSAVNVAIAGEVQSISIQLLDGLDGNTASNMSITLSIVNSCVALNCTDSDGDGICDSVDQCPGIDDNLIGTSCDDGDSCTINDIYDTNCNCAGTFADSDGDGVCDGDDVCPGGDDTIDLNGNGIPDDCDCTNDSDSFSPSTLNHSGSGSNAVSFNFTNLSRDVSFSISGLDARTNGNPRNRYEEVATVSYIDTNGQTQTLGSFSGANQSNANIFISEYISEVTVSLSNGVSGSSTALSVNLSGIDFCTQSANPIAPPGQPGESSGNFGETQSSGLDLNIFPNPANTEVNIAFVSPNNKNYSIEIKSVLGQTIYKTQNRGTGSDTRAKLNATNWQAGMYFVIVSVEKEITVKKVIIQQ